jgi:hypothetical protein
VNSYLVERYLPGLSEAELRSGLDRAQALCHELSAEGIDVRYLGSIFLPVEEACFCRFESDGAETVVEVNQRAQCRRRWKTHPPPPVENAPLLRRWWRRPGAG